MSLDELRLDQVDRALAAPALAAVPASPAIGWLRTIRQALGMTTRQFAQRARASLTAALAAERGEAGGTISLNQLRRYAEALDCELRYVLVPRTSLRTRVERQAEELARRQVDAVRQTMALEAQDAGADFAARQVDALKAELLRGRRARLWD